MCAAWHYVLSAHMCCYLKCRCWIFGLQLQLPCLLLLKFCCFSSRTVEKQVLRVAERSLWIRANLWNLLYIELATWISGMHLIENYRFQGSRVYLLYPNTNLFGNYFVVHIPCAEILPLNKIVLVKVYRQKEQGPLSAVRLVSFRKINHNRPQYTTGLLNVPRNSRFGS